MEYNEIMQKAGRQIVTSITYEDITITSDEITRAKPYFNAKLVGTIMKGLELETKKDIPNSNPIYFNNTAKYKQEEKSVTYGPYYVESVGYNADKKTFTYQMYDEFIKSMVDYEPVEVDYPCTILNFFKALVNKLGWTTEIDYLPNGDKLINQDIYTGINYTYRSVLEDIGQATASLFTIENGVIKRCVFENTKSFLITQDNKYIVTQDNKYIVVRRGSENLIRINDDLLKNKNIAFGEHYGPINSIVLTRSADSDSVYIRDEEATEWHEFRIADNQLMNGNNRSEFLQDLFDELKEIEFDVFDTKLTGYGLIEPLQPILFETNGKEYESFVFNGEEVFTQGYEQSIYTDFPTETNTDYKAADKQDNLIRQAYIIVNKQKLQIESLVQTTEDLGDGINNNATQISQIIQDASGLTGYFANAEGAKYIKLTAEGIKVSKDDNSSYVQITEKGVDIYDKVKTKVASMKANEFDTTNWIYSENPDSNNLNIFKRRPQ